MGSIKKLSQALVKLSLRYLSEKSLEGLTLEDKVEALCNVLLMENHPNLGSGISILRFKRSGLVIEKEGIKIFHLESALSKSVIRVKNPEQEEGIYVGRPNTAQFKNGVVTLTWDEYRKLKSQYKGRLVAISRFMNEQEIEEGITSFESNQLNQSQNQDQSNLLELIAIESLDEKKEESINQKQETSNEIAPIPQLYRDKNAYAFSFFKGPAQPSQNLPEDEHELLPAPGVNS